MKIDLDKITEVYRKKNFPYFTKGDFNLNLFGIRTNDNTSNAFNDYIGVTYKENGKWVLKLYGATTDPGVYYRNNPMSVNGTGILCPGYIKKAFKVGRHRNQYEALVQNVPFKVWRDNNKDNVLDTGNNVPVFEGMYGVNLHRATANPGGESVQVDKWSALCQVIANYDEYQELMDIINISADMYGPVFSYALFEENDF